MKRRDLIRHLESLGCRLLREGGRHSLYVNPAMNATSAVPRHMEMNQKPLEIVDRLWPRFELDPEPEKLGVSK